jgi:hypothetical protein
MHSSLVFDFRCSLSLIPHFISPHATSYGHYFIVIFFGHPFLYWPHTLGIISYSLSFHPMGPEHNPIEDEFEGTSLAWDLGHFLGSPLLLHETTSDDSCCSYRVH